MSVKRQFYKISEVAEIMGLSNKTLRRKIRSGRIGAIKNDGMTGAYLVPASELSSFIKSLGI